MRYIIGIDLGTTNSSVSYVDTQHPPFAIQPFRIPQLVQEDISEALPTLPSFCYLCGEREFPHHSGRLVGKWAQQLGAKVPTRLVQSAKSWLCHSGANRRDRILPLDAADNTNRISPVEASMLYLRHIKDAWNETLAKEKWEYEFEQQEVILTVPASFDEVARALTVEAAKQAGFSQMTLLEEPQAAFYSWIDQHEKRWKGLLKPGQSILVCDVGGGTTDFSLIRTVQKGEDLAFERIAVGDHLLLGGDNMDIAIAHFLEKKLNAELSHSQWLQLCHEARQAKEHLLQPGGLKYQVVLHGTGSSVVKGSLTTSIEREEIERLLLDGFFGDYSWDEAIRFRKSSGLKTMGLPYEEEPSITKHLAHFIHTSAQGDRSPDFLLFNGGTMKPQSFQKAILHSLHRWFPQQEVKVLETASLDLAVSRGAAYFGKVRHGLGVRIGGGTARSVYVGISVRSAGGEVREQALTLLPRGSEEGETYQAAESFRIKSNTPVTFQLFSSHTRLNDQKGQLVPINAEEMHPLPPLYTVLRYGKTQDEIPVHLQAQLTPLGTVELSLYSPSTSHRWLLEFQLRNAQGHDDSLSMVGSVRKDESYDVAFFKPAQDAIIEAFSEKRPNEMMEALEKILELPRKDWNISLLRNLWSALHSQAPQRKLSQEHEVRWWNLAGFLLRPGYGYPLDDHRLKEFWKIILSDMKGINSQPAQIQTWICYRRIAGGFNKGQQTQLASEILPRLINKKGELIESKDRGEQYAISEQLRCIAAFEWLDQSLKTKIGDAILKRIIKGQGDKSDFWSMERVGARHLLYGSSANVVPVATCSRWIENLLEAAKVEPDQVVSLLCQLARKTDHREINISNALIEKCMAKFQNHPKFSELESHLTQLSQITRAEQEFLYGERLPPGLILEITQEV